MAEASKKKEVIFDLYSSVQTEKILKDMQEQQTAMREQAKSIFSRVLDSPKMREVLKTEKSEISEIVRNLDKLNVTGVKTMKMTEYV